MCMCTYVFVSPSVLFIKLQLFYFSIYIFVLYVYILNAYLYYLLLSLERLVTVLFICMSRQSAACKPQATNHQSLAAHANKKKCLLITATHNRGDNTWCSVCRYSPSNGTVTATVAENSLGTRRTSTAGHRTPPSSSPTHFRSTVGSHRIMGGVYLKDYFISSNLLLMVVVESI